MAYAIYRLLGMLDDVVFKCRWYWLCCHIDRRWSALGYPDSKAELRWNDAFQQTPDLFWKEWAGRCKGVNAVLNLEDL